MRSNSLPVVALGATLLIVLRLRTATAILDLQEVHRLCQAREFYSFRRKVCTLVRRKRSLPEDTYGGNPRSAFQSRFRDLPNAFARWLSTHDKRGNTSDAIAPFTLQNKNKFPDIQTPNMLFLINLLKKSQQPPNSVFTYRINGSKTDQSKGQSDPKNLFFVPSENNVSSLGFPLVRGFKDPTGHLAGTSDPSPFLHLFVPHMSSGDRSDENHGAFHESNHEPMTDFSSLRLLNETNWLNLMGHRGKSHRNSKPNEVMPSESDRGPPVVESGVIFDPTDAAHLYHMQSFDDEGKEETYGHWSTAWEDASTNVKPDWSEEGATIGMLREHCCLYGCTLQRHFHNFLSTCVTMK